MTRLLIAGVPRSGKTTAANAFGAAVGLTVRHTDDLIATHAWSEASAEAAKWIGVSDGIIEGVAVPRALRKWLAAHPTGKPADVVVWMPEPRVVLTPGQVVMAKGCVTVWREVLPQLVARGVVVGTVDEITEMAKRRIAS